MEAGTPKVVSQVDLPPVEKMELDRPRGDDLLALTRDRLTAVSLPDGEAAAPAASAPQH